MSRNVLLISDQVLKDRTSLHGNVDPKMLRADIKFVQDSRILPLIGSALMGKLQDQIENQSFSPPYQKLLDSYIIDALIYYTMATLPMSLSFQMYNKGVIRKVGENTETPSMSDLVDLANEYERKAEFYGNRLKKYLEANTLTYPEYLNPGNGIDTIWPTKKAFTTPIYLGMGDEDCDRGWGPYNAGAPATVDQSSLNLTYTANGTEGSLLNLPQIIDSVVVLITRENAVLYQVNDAPDTTEYTVSGTNIILGSPTQPGERFLVLYKRN